MSVPARVALAMLTACAFAILAGCAGSHGSVVVRESMVEFTDTDREKIASSEAAPYLLQPGDIFSLQSLVDAELTQHNILVLPDGSAGFVGLGSFKVAGRAIAEVEAQVSDAYSRKFRDVDLSLVVHQTTGRKVYVLGEVKNPGLYDIPAGGVIGAVTRAGGFSEWSDQGSVVLMRMTPAGYMCREIDVQGLRDGATFDAAALDLQPFDIIWVSRSRIGDFAAFTKNVVTSLTQYSRLILDVMQIDDPIQFRR